MKKILSLLLVGIMVISMIPTAWATTNYTNGTQVQYNAEADNDNDGQPDHSEAWTVTVPALLEPGASGDVVAQGTWASNRKLVVDAADSVTLANSINTNDTKELVVTFAGIELAGSNTVAVSATEAVGVADIEDALFGTWSGIFYYQVGMEDNISLIEFTIDGVVYQARPGMTWNEWVISELNVNNYFAEYVEYGVYAGEYFIHDQNNTGEIYLNDEECVFGADIIIPSGIYNLRGRPC